MYLGYHWSITMEMKSCQSTGRTKTRRKLNRWSTRTQNITLGIYEVFFVYTVSQVSNLFENLQPPKQSGMLLYTKNRREISDSPVLQDPQLDLELTDVLGGVSILFSCFPSQSRSLLLLTSHHPCPLWPLQVLICSAPISRRTSLQGKNQMAWHIL